MVKIAVASGKGGTGKTFVSTNIFYTMLTSNYRVMLVDCDAEAPNAIAFFKTELIISKTQDINDPVTPLKT